METILRRTWDGMKQAILSGNIDAAMTYFVSDEVDQFRDLANDPAVQFAARLAEIDRIELNVLEGKMAEAAAIRMEYGEEIAYPVSFVMDEKGVWKIFGF
jgi:hypothetical protein